MMKNNNQHTGGIPWLINCRAKAFGIVTAMLLLLCATVLGCIFLMPETTVYADDEGPAAEVSYIGDDNETVITESYDTFSAAWNTAQEKSPATIKMLRGVKYVSTGNGFSFTVESGKDITLDLNGNVLDLSGSAGSNRNIKVNGGTLTIKDSLPETANTVTSGVTNESVTISGGAITGCYATSGGVYVSNGGTLNMDGGNIAGNKFSNNKTYGSGVYVDGDGSKLVMTKGSIAHNYCASGSVYVNGGAFTMSGGSIHGNQAVQYGGGVFVTDGEFEMSKNADISDNQALNGGGVYGEDGCTLTIKGGTISNNRISYYGGGVYTYGSSSKSVTLKLSGGTISGNKTRNSSGGGGIYFTLGTFELSGNPVVSDNYGGVDAGYNGGNKSNMYLYIADSKNNQQKVKLVGKLDGAKIGVSLHNTSNGEKHTGVFTTDYGSFDHGDDPNTYFSSDNDDYYIDFDGSELAVVYDAVNYKVMVGEETIEEKKIGFFEDAWKEALGVTSGTVTITLLEDLTIAADVPDMDKMDNADLTIVLDLNGHTLDLNSDRFSSKKRERFIRVNQGVFTLEDSSDDGVGILKGGYNQSQGGALYVSGTFNMNGGTISNNYSLNDGGGVCVSGTFNMNGGTISDNEVGRDYCGGGGVYASGTFNMNGGAISGNRASSYGGGVFVRAGTFNMSKGMITENRASCGGGVYLMGKFTFDMSGTAEIYKNYATSNGYAGGGVYAVYETYDDVWGNFSLNGCRIRDNSASSGYGGGIYLRGNVAFEMTDGEITGNTAGSSGGGGVYVASYNGRKPMFRISGSPVIDSNNKQSGATKTTNNVYLESGCVLTVAGALDNAAIGVTLGSTTGKFTSGYSTEGFNNSEDPSDYFSSDSLKLVIIEDGEAKVSNEAAVTHTVNFYDEDEEILLSKTVVHGQKVKYTGELPTKENTPLYTYTFGWFTKNGTTYTPFDIANAIIVDDLDLYARFTETPNSFVVTLSVPNGFGALSHSEVTVLYGTEIIVGDKQLTMGSTTVTLTLGEGEVLVGWNVNGEALEGSAYTVIGNTQIEAVVKKNVTLVWTYKNENVNTRAYNGESDNGEIRVAVKDSKGNTLKSFTGLNAEVNMVEADGATAFKNVGVYTFSLVGSDDFDIDKYSIEKNEFEFTITPYVIDVSGVSFADAKVIYDGNAHSLPVVSSLPEGVHVTYSDNNSFTDPGKYGVVATLAVSDSNYELEGDTELDAALYILESELIVYVDGTNTVWLSAHSANGFPVGARLSIRLIDGYSSQLIESEIGAAFDITLVDADGNSISFDGTATLRLLIPEALRSLPDGYSLGLVHVHGTTATKLDVRIDGDYAEFTTDSLSAFVFVQNSTAAKPAPNENGMWWIWIVVGGLALLIVILLLILILRKKKTGYSNPPDYT